MLFFKDNGEVCSTRSETTGCRSICLISTTGLILGWFAMSEMALPPSSILVEEQKQLIIQRSAEVMDRLDVVEKLVIELKSDVKVIKEEILGGKHNHNN